MACSSPTVSEYTIQITLPEKQRAIRPRTFILLICRIQSEESGSRGRLFIQEYYQLFINCSHVYFLDSCLVTTNHALCKLYFPLTFRLRVTNVIWNILVLGFSWLISSSLLLPFCMCQCFWPSKLQIINPFR